MRLFALLLSVLWRAVIDRGFEVAGCVRCIARVLDHLADTFSMGQFGWQALVLQNTGLHVGGQLESRGVLRAGTSRH